MSTATYTFDENLFSDLHKDATGFRPNAAFFKWVSTATATEKQAEWDSLVTAMEAREASRKEDQRVAIMQFESVVTKTLNSGAATRAQAIQWLMDGEDVRGDTQYFEFLMGVPYGYIAKHS